MKSSNEPPRPMNDFLWCASKFAVSSIKQAKGVVSTVSKTLGVDSSQALAMDLPKTDSGYVQWLNAMRAVAKLDDGVPHHFRGKLWLTIADHYLTKKGVNWSNICELAFHENIRRDEEELGEQIIKDLHRTGLSGLNYNEQVILKRVLLGYARCNPRVGYCQGFNIIAALIMEVMDYQQENALKVLLLLIEHVLPEGYFDESLRALSVDMAVLRQLMHQKLPKLSAHLDYLQKDSDSQYEPPLINVFSMQWFLTLFATCLPQHAVFRVWDSIMLEGSEILLRTALSIWARISRRIFMAQTVDEFYSLMGPISQELTMMRNPQCNDLMQIIYGISEFPFPGVTELRERYTWNAQPVSSSLRALRSQVSQVLTTGTNGEDSELERASFASITGVLLTPSRGSDGNEKSIATDLSTLQKQYKHLKDRQKQAAVILQNAYAKKGQAMGFGPFNTTCDRGGKSGRSEAFNHLYVKNNTQNKNSIVKLSGSISVSSKAIQPKTAYTGGCVDKDLALPGLKHQRRHQRSSSSSVGSYATAVNEHVAPPPLTPVANTVHEDLSVLNYFSTQNTTGFQVNTRHYGDLTLASFDPLDPGGNFDPDAKYSGVACASRSPARLANRKFHGSLDSLTDSVEALLCGSRHMSEHSPPPSAAEYTISAYSEIKYRWKPEHLRARSKSCGSAKFETKTFFYPAIVQHVRRGNSCIQLYWSSDPTRICGFKCSPIPGCLSSPRKIAEQKNKENLQKSKAAFKILENGQFSQNHPSRPDSIAAGLMSSNAESICEDSSVFWPGSNQISGQSISRGHKNVPNGRGYGAHAPPADSNRIYRPPSTLVTENQAEKPPNAEDTTNILYGLPVHSSQSGTNSGRKSTLIAKSKQMVNALPDPKNAAPTRPFNPFPKHRTTSLLKKEKQMGLIA